jgi:predicted transcriptional regulator
MEPPADHRTAGSDEEPPDFDALAEPADVLWGGKTRDRVYATVLQLDEPAKVAEIADRSDVGPDAAREYLQWFADMGLVVKVDDQPARYRVNREYLLWRRANRLSQENSLRELVNRASAVRDEIADYEHHYGVDSPSVSVFELAADHDRPVEDVWEDISRWKGLERRFQLLGWAYEMQNARQQQVVYEGVVPETDAEFATEEREDESLIDR